MDLKKIYNSLSSKKYNIQEVYYCYEITLDKIKREGLKCNLHEIIIILILNLKNEIYQNKTKALLLGNYLPSKQLYMQYLYFMI